MKFLPQEIYLAIPIRSTKITSKKDSLYYLPGDIAGITGIERAYEKQLRGEKGMRYIQKDIKLRNVGF